MGDVAAQLDGWSEAGDCSCQQCQVLTLQRVREGCLSAGRAQSAFSPSSGEAAPRAAALCVPLSGTRGVRLGTSRLTALPRPAAAAGEIAWRSAAALSTYCRCPGSPWIHHQPVLKYFG